MVQSSLPLLKEFRKTLIEIYLPLFVPYLEYEISRQA